MQAGCKIFLNHSGMTHISLVLMFTYVKDRRKLRTDGAVSLLPSQHALFFFSGQDHSYALQQYIGAVGQTGGVQMV